MIDFKSELETFAPIENIGENDSLDETQDMLDVLAEISKQISNTNKE